MSKSMPGGEQPPAYRPPQMPGSAPTWRLLVGAVAAALLLAAGVIWLEVYHFDDCRRVGHTLTYCVIDIFR